MAIVFSKASGVADSIYGKSQEPIKMMLEKEVNAFEEMSAIKKIFKNVPTTNFAEKMTAMTAMDEFEIVPEGGAYPASEIQESYSKVIEPVTWLNSFVITQEMMEDKKLTEIGQKAMGFTESYNLTREKYAGLVLANGVKGSFNYKGYMVDTTSADKKPLFYKEHPSVIKGQQAQSNLFADAFSKAALGAVETSMQMFTDDKGNVLNVSPDTIIIPNDYRLKNSVFEVIGSDKDPNTSNNGFNYQFGRWNVIVWPYLGEVAGAELPWILMDSKYNQRRGGAIDLDRLGLRIKSYIDNNNDNNVWNGRARFQFGFNNWRAFAIGGVTGGTTLVG